MYRAAIILIGGLALLSNAAWAQRSAVRPPIPGNGVMEQPIPKEPIIRSGVRFYFGPGAAPLGLRRLGTVAVAPQTGAGCDGALEGALALMAAQARRTGADAVIEVVSDARDSVGGSRYSYLCDNGAVSLTGTAATDRQSQ
jgi:hypothetical protein